MAVSSIILTVEGVLRKHVTAASIPVGITLYHGLANTFNVLLVSDLEKAELDRWCALEGLNRHAATEHNEGVISHFDPDFRRLQQVNNLRNRGYHIDMVIEPDPGIAAKLLRHGFNCMVFAHAEYALPQWRPDYEVKPRSWDDIEAYHEEMAKLKAIEMLTEEKNVNLRQ